MLNHAAPVLLNDRLVDVNILAMVAEWRVDKNFTII